MSTTKKKPMTKLKFKQQKKKPMTTLVLNNETMIQIDQVLVVELVAVFVRVLVVPPGIVLVKLQIYVFDYVVFLVKFRLLLLVRVIENETVMLDEVVLLDEVVMLDEVVILALVVPPNLNMRVRLLNHTS